MFPYSEWYLLVAPIASFIVYILFIEIHNKRLQKILVIDNLSELNKESYFRYPNLMFADIFLGLFIITAIVSVTEIILMSTTNSLKYFIEYFFVSLFNTEAIRIDIIISLGFVIISSALRMIITIKPDEFRRFTMIMIPLSGVMYLVVSVNFIMGYFMPFIPIIFLLVAAINSLFFFFPIITSDKSVLIESFSSIILF